MGVCQAQPRKPTCAVYATQECSQICVRFQPRSSLYISCNCCCNYVSPSTVLNGSNRRPRRPYTSTAKKLANFSTLRVSSSCDQPDRGSSQRQSPPSPSPPPIHGAAITGSTPGSSGAPPRLTLPPLSVSRHDPSPGGRPIASTRSGPSL